MTKNINEEEIRFMLSWGLTQTEIGKRLGVSQQVISYRVKKIRLGFPWHSVPDYNRL